MSLKNTNDTKDIPANMTRKKNVARQENNCVATPPIREPMEGPRGGAAQKALSKLVGTHAMQQRIHSFGFRGDDHNVYLRDSMLPSELQSERRILKSRYAPSSLMFPTSSPDLRILQRASRGIRLTRKTDDHEEVR